MSEDCQPNAQAAYGGGELRPGCAGAARRYRSDRRALAVPGNRSIDSAREPVPPTMNGCKQPNRSLITGSHQAPSVRPGMEPLAEKRWLAGHVTASPARPGSAGTGQTASPARGGTFPTAARTVTRPARHRAQPQTRWAGWVAVAAVAAAFLAGSTWATLDQAPDQGPPEAGSSIGRPAIDSRIARPAGGALGPATSDDGTQAPVSFTTDPAVVDVQPVAVVEAIMVRHETGVAPSAQPGPTGEAPAVGGTSPAAPAAASVDARAGGQPPAQSPEAPRTSVAAAPAAADRRGSACTAFLSADGTCPGSGARSSTRPGTAGRTGEQRRRQQRPRRERQR